MQGYSRAALQVCEARRERFDELFAAYLATEQLANPDATRSRRGIAAQVAGGAWWFEQHRSVLQQCSRSPRLGTAHQLAAAVVEQLETGRPLGASTGSPVGSENRNAPVMGNQRCSSTCQATGSRQ